MLPFLIPGILIQIAIRIYYIKRCWESESLSVKRRAWWSVAITLFNLPAAVVFLFVTKAGKSAVAENIDKRDYDPNIKEAVSILPVSFKRNSQKLYKPDIYEN